MPGFRKKLFACCRASRDKDERILDYRHKGLKEIPSDVFRNQKTLEELHLDKNQLSTLPPELFSKCTNLRKLTLCDNELTQLPTSLGSLLLLEELDVSRNLLVDVPPTVVSCRNLRALDLSFNPIHMSTLAITQLFSLVKLSLNSASIEYLPAAMGRLSNLRVLELRENSIQVLPQSISSLTQLERLDLGKNRLIEMPDIIGCLTNLHELCCDNNRISRISSRALSPLSRLIFLDLSCNQIVQLPSEPLPVSLGDLHLSSNRLRSLPESLCALENLTTLKVDNNVLESLPTQLGLMSTMAELNASKNRINWLPPSIGMLRQLHTLQLDDNRLVDLPGELGSCANLSLLSLANNRLARLPEQLGSLRRLKVLVLSGNALLTLPYSFIDLHQLQALWLTEGQSKPNVQLHEDTDPSSGQRVLTCFLLPQRAAMSSSQSPCKDASNSQSLGSRSSRHRREHNSQRLAGVEEEEENNASDAKQGYSESETGGPRQSRRNSDFAPQFMYEDAPPRRRSSRRNPMVVDDGMDDINGYRSDADGYRYSRHSVHRNSAAPSVHFGAPAGLCRPFDHSFPGDVNAQQFPVSSRPPLPLAYHYGVPQMGDFQFPPAHRQYQYNGELSMPSRDCMSDTESGAKRRLFAGNHPQRHAYRNNRTGIAQPQQQQMQQQQQQQMQQMPPPQSVNSRPISTGGTTYDWPLTGRLSVQQHQAAPSDDPTGCSGVPPTMAEEPLDMGGMLSSISVTSASSAAPSLLMPSVRGAIGQNQKNQMMGTQQWSVPVSNVPTFPSSPNAVYTITHHPSVVNGQAPGLLQVNLSGQSMQQRGSMISAPKQGQTSQGQTLPGFVGHSTPHNCIGRMEPDSLISCGAGSTDSGFDAHSQQQHGSSSATGQLSGGAGAQTTMNGAMSSISPAGVPGGGEAPSNFNEAHEDVLNGIDRANGHLGITSPLARQVQQHTNMDDSDLVCVDANPMNQQVTVFSAIILKNPGLGFSIAGGRDSGCYLPFDDPTGVYVTKVQHDGPASSILRIGDKLLSVDGRSFESISHQDAVAVLRSCGPRVELRVSRSGNNALSPYQSESSVFQQAGVTSPPNARQVSHYAQA